MYSSAPANLVTLILSHPTCHQWATCRIVVTEPGEQRVYREISIKTLLENLKKKKRSKIYKMGHVHEREELEGVKYMRERKKRETNERERERNTHTHTHTNTK